VESNFQSTAFSPFSGTVDFRIENLQPLNQDSFLVKDSASKEAKAEVKLQVIDLNKADAASLEQLPGIGSVLSTRIIKFRKRLGYFASVDMLALVYGFSEENRNKALPWLSTPSLPEPALSLQTAGWKALRQLSFLEKETINAILKRQRSKVPFNTWEEVADLPSMDPKHLTWLKGYASL
jgi:DNA uptake protein ComE-like DNA-binding protein